MINKILNKNAFDLLDFMKIYNIIIEWGELESLLQWLYYGHSEEYVCSYLLEYLDYIGVNYPSEWVVKKNRYENEKLVKEEC
jgi:hypothetical protein